MLAAVWDLDIGSFEIDFKWILGEALEFNLPFPHLNSIIKCFAHKVGLETNLKLISYGNT